MINSAVLRHSRRTFGAYKMAKAALHAVASSLATELGPQGIRVNSVAPGHLETETGAHLNSQQLEQIARRPPLGRLPEMGDVTPVVEFLASPAARFITGQTLVIDGGLTA
jgi:NAD(P)-dependent dehydrogenase (short-subunit alcohol dehydrogenase family)